ncbi:thioesterase II family protein [Streptomyces cyanogenus]|uniref:Linear gramicidin dehydrogenase LgrE n=1 Tax=Streptomyces cyanogenus TaxID=80860 RepID=A0ABX7TY08_STRCY|nr:alpha/beta fold hydrolase [Streptomyces cyanogenus]QTE01457.1 Linear gramicidin dehydrogenase LgrE [Streptomyces cyanogenus]
MSLFQDTTVIRLRRSEDAARTLICLGFCGGGAGAYHLWADTLPEGTDLTAICYPGREGRFLEDFATDWAALAEDAASAVISAVDRPYILFGHSMGGWMAFDVTARIEAAGQRAPDALVVSSCNAPSRGLTPRDMFPSRDDTDTELLEWMKTHGLMAPHVLGDPDLQEMALEIMRADIRVRDTFRYTADSKVTTPVQMLSGIDDGVIESDAGVRWRELTVGDYRHDPLPGGHFYTPEIWKHLPQYIAAIGTLARV